MSGRDDDLHRLAEVQYGLFSLSQLRALGFPRAAIEQRLRTGRWNRLAAGTYGVAGHHPSWRRDLWRAHLHAGPDSVISHESAGRLQGFRQVRARRITVIVPGVRRHPPDGVTWHRLTDLSLSDITFDQGLPVTTAARTAIDLASVLHLSRLRLLVEQGAVEGTLQLSEVGSVLGRVRRRGKPGVRKMADVLDALGPGDGLPHSELERLLDDAIALAGIPAPVHEHPLPTTSARTGFVDRCWPEARLIVEADGRKWHARRQQILADADRTLEAQAVGYETSRMLWEHLRHDGDGMAALLRQVYLQRLLLLDPEPGS